MSRRFTNVYIFLHSVGDLFILLVSYLCALYFSLGSLYYLLDTKYQQLFVYLNLIYLLSGKLSGTFNMYRNTQITTIATMLVKLFFFQVILSFSYIVVFKDFNETFKISREALLYTYSISFVLTTIWRFSFFKLVRYFRAKGYNTKKAIIIGAGPAGQEFKRMLEGRMEFGISVLGFFDDEPERFPQIQHLIKGNLKEAKLFARENQIDEIFCALPYKQEEKIIDLITFSEKYLIRLKIVPNFTHFLTTQFHKLEIDYFDTYPVMMLRQEPLEIFINRVAKRGFDFVFTIAVSLTILWWLIPLIAILIKINSKGPVFFVQERTGIKNKSFKVYKFRTMFVNGDSDSIQATKGDSRITPIGAFLRKSNLDEIPQFINVFLGHMSIIGPRPHMLKHTEEYSKIIDKFMVRHFIKPGITGWAQVNGFRGETRNPEEMEERVKADIWYIENWSFLLDIRIVFMTIFNMIRGEEKAY
ncbi:MAG: undecaprenyl-phosphate glucose phosphotransferase [Chitinophagales bacterium]|nr:undecaprenyl-phosphate glucose phosphotransferase [Chitinophagales bacterium]MCZ2393898.1 undecaprenyl-phosphate glucose phosphotransferase [Chitinophagales bacterium]